MPSWTLGIKYRWVISFLLNILKVCSLWVLKVTRGMEPCAGFCLEKEIGKTSSSVTRSDRIPFPCSSSSQHLSFSFSCVYFYPLFIASEIWCHWYSQKQHYSSGLEPQWNETVLWRWQRQNCLFLSGSRPGKIIFRNTVGSCLLTFGKTIFIIVFLFSLYSWSLSLYNLNCYL